jgi:diguanylate cyclase (GGDEF)-like protein
MNIINNNYGYPVGDQIIDAVAKSLKNLPRHAKDWISSFRGARFALVMYDLSENQLGRIYNTIYEQIDRINFSSDGNVIKIEVGIGYHILKDSFITTDQFIEKAKEMIKTESRLEGNDNSIKRLILKYSFTYREKEIALLLLSGKSNIEIASALYIGLSTVKKHISSIFRKMDVKSRTELVSKLNHEVEK